MRTRWLIAVIAFLATYEGVPRLWFADAAARTLWGESAPSPTFLHAWDALVAESERQRGTQLEARRSAHDALATARTYLALPRDASVLDDAAAAAREHRYGAAAALSLRVLEVPQSDVDAQRANDIAATATLALGRFDEAHRAAQAALSFANATPEVPQEGWRHVRAMRAAWGVQDPAAAMHHADRVLELLPRRRVWHEARFLAAWSRMELPEHRAEGVRRARRLLDLYPEYPDTDALTLALADAEIALGRRGDAAARLDAWVWDHAFHDWAERAEATRATLSDVARPRRSLDDERERGRALRRSRHWNAARRVLADALDRCVDEGASNAACNAIRLQIVLNEHEDAQFAAAIGMLDAIEARGSEGVSARERSKWRARALSRLGHEDEAYEVLAAFYATQPDARRHLALGEFAADLGRYEQAYAHYQEVWREWDWQTFEGAFLTYLSGRHGEAENLFAALARRTHGRERAGARYWQARAIARQGRVDDAIALWQAVSDEYPTRYYGLQSRNRIQDWADAVDGRPAMRPGRIHWHGPEGPAQASLSDALATAQAPLFEPYAPEVAADGALERFAEEWGELFPDAHEALGLYRVGDREQARSVLRDVLVEFWALEELFDEGRRPTTRWPIRLETRAWSHRIDTRREKRGWWGIALGESIYPAPSGRRATESYVERHQSIYEEREAIRVAARAAGRDVGDHYMVRRIVFDQETFSNLYAEGADRTPWLEAYPHAYAYIARPELERYDMNPYVLWSLMIVESDLNPDTVSFADAYGLLQVIPKTGEKIALGFGEPDFGVHDLMDTAAAFRFGAWYFNELLTKFHGQEMLAMVAYNAGPHQVQRWLTWRGDVLDLDEFIETVPFVGARRYPQTIHRYLLTYRLTYGEASELYVGNALDATYEDNIYY